MRIALIEVYRGGYWVEWPDDADLVVEVNKLTVLECRGVEIPPPWRCYRDGQLVIARAE